MVRILRLVEYFSFFFFFFSFFILFYFLFFSVFFFLSFFFFFILRGKGEEEITRMRGRKRREREEGFLREVRSGRG